uniref:Ubiquitin-like domain-containing protein n=1 Tax=Arcella intermedia TaxID=1963864 RepID=A0A6B2LWT1_9EUKA
MRVWIKFVTGKCVTIEVDPLDTIMDVKQRLEDKEGIPAHQVALLYASQKLRDTATLYDNIPDESILHLDASLAGG